MRLSIIIVNWHSVDYLRVCLDSIYRETRALEFEVIVVDNSPVDGCCQQMLEAEFPEVVFHPSNENLGFARACNLGAQLSLGDILLFLNPDTEIRDNVFSRMASHLCSDPSIGAVGARLLNTDGSLQTSCIQAYPTMANQLLDSEFLRGLFPKSQLWGMAALFDASTEPTAVDAVSGACLMVTRDAFERAGQFEEGYFMYVEDLDLCYKIARAGFQLHFLKECEVVHHGGTSSAQQGSHFASLRQQEAIVRFFCVRRGAWYGRAYRAALATAAVTRMALLAFLVPFRKFAQTTSDAAFGLRKWSLIFRWAIGWKA